jgi:cyclic beta-1,2-glucan synthetase
MTDGEAGAHLDVLVAAARELQARHRIEPPPARPIPAWVAVDAVESWLRRARVHSADPEPEAAKAAEWLLDNDYQVERAVRQIREDLPIEFYARLPKVVNPGDDGIPRVFSLARTLLEASRLQLSLSGAAEFVRAYQEGAALTIAELWAFPTMLRLACLEILVGAFGRLAPPVKAPFEITRGAAISTLPEDTECVARSLANLGVIATISWNDFFEGVSRVDATLRADPAQVYGRMDFATRDR